MSSSCQSRIWRSIPDSPWLEKSLLIKTAALSAYAGTMVEALLFNTIDLQCFTHLGLQRVSFPLTLLGELNPPGLVAISAEVSG